ncbi:hypothetical protein L4D76_01425 [Photobacterium sagamiensis]|uniref:hypothetical protein n=1 Tax=Photobacterium sagamiensis TaxID=2910241 RepID=UPI003D0EDDF4
MLKLQSDTRLIIGDILVQYHIFSTDAPLMITFSPAGSVLKPSQVEAGCSAWGFDFFKKMGVNIISFSAIQHKHWFISPQLVEFINKLSPQLEIFPERLGYGASMGAFATSLYSSQLQLDRLLLITPLTPSKEQYKLSKFDYCAQHKGNITIIFDPLCQNDKQHALRYPLDTTFLKLYGVGHQVIESMSQVGYLKSIVLKFVTNEVKRSEFEKAMRARRNIERYYSYMARNPTKKLTPRRLKVIRYYFLMWHLKNPTQFILKWKKKWQKSLMKRTDFFVLSPKY